MGFESHTTCLSPGPGAFGSPTEAESVVAEVTQLIDQAKANTELLSDMLVNTDGVDLSDDFENMLIKDLVTEVGSVHAPDTMEKHKATLRMLHGHPGLVNAWLTEFSRSCYDHSSPHHKLSSPASQSRGEVYSVLNSGSHSSMDTVEPT